MRTIGWPAMADDGKAATWGWLHVEAALFLPRLQQRDNLSFPGVPGLSRNSLCLLPTIDAVVDLHFYGK